MKRFTFRSVIVILLSAFGAPLFAPPLASQQCPSIEVKCPSYPQEADGPITFSANVNGAPSNAKLIYIWEVSSGRIESGQGTTEIVVDTTGTGGQTPTATLKVRGLDAACGTTASCSAPPFDPPISRKFDQYDELSRDEERKRLEMFGEQLGNEPGSQGYIISYAGRGISLKLVRAHVKAAKTYLINRYQIEPARLVTVEGGRRKKTEYELWIVPTGAKPPKANPA